MAGKSISVSILADTRELAKNLSTAEGDLKSFGDTADATGKEAKASLDNVGEGADTVASKGAQAAGALSGLGDLVGGPFGAAMVVGGTAMQAAADAGDLLNVAVEGGAKLASKAGAAMTSFANATGLSTVASKIAAAATKAWALAQRVLNKAFLTSPMGLVIVAVVALAAAFVVAYKKSDKFRAIVQKGIAIVKKVVGSFVGFFKTAVPKAFDVVVNAVQRGFGAVKTGVDKVIGFIKDIPSRIKNLVSNMLNAGKDFIGGFFKGVLSAAGNAGGFISSLMSSIKNAINSALRLPLTIDFDKGPLHIHTTLIPALAKGGIVNSPTLALIGEAGPEAVVPLSKMDSVGGGRRVVQLVFHGPVLGTKEAIGKFVRDALDEYDATGGVSFA